MRIRTLLDDTFTKADLEIVLKATAKGNVKIALSKDGNVLMTEESALGSDTRLVMKVDNPALWSAESPVLYDLLFQVFDNAGTLTEVIPYRVGFRRFEMKDNIMMLNGRRIVFKGVNRHEFSSVSGRHVSREELVKDIVTMKRNNINAIRTCHYPDGSDIYDLCDEYGLYMIAENNLESHGSWDSQAEKKEPDLNKVVPCDHPEWLGMMLDRVNSMYQRDKNHTAILIWSCGNESFGGKDIYEMSTAKRTLQGWCTMRGYSGTADITDPVIWKARCILLWRASRHFWRKAGANRLSVVNTRMPWEIPVVPCTNTQI